MKTVDAVRACVNMWMLKQGACYSAKPLRLSQANRIFSFVSGE